MSDYTVEPVLIATNAADIYIGDTVRFSAFYIANYGKSSEFQGVEGEVMKIVTRTVNVEGIEKGDRPMYASRYGKLPTYEVIGLYVKFTDRAGLYLGSPFGFEKV